MASPDLGKLLLDLTEGVPYRRNTRLPLALPLKLSGKDKDGRDFEESAFTVDVGKRGIRTATIHPLLPQAQVAVSNPREGMTRAARVVWQGTVNGSGSRAEIGLEFLEPLGVESLWLIEPLPDDWWQGALTLTTDQKLDYYWERGRTSGADARPQAWVEVVETTPVAAPPSADEPAIEEEIKTAETVEPPPAETQQSESSAAAVAEESKVPEQSSVTPDSEESGQNPQTVTNIPLETAPPAEAVETDSVPREAAASLTACPAEPQSTPDDFPAKAATEAQLPPDSAEVINEKVEQAVTASLDALRRESESLLQNYQTELQKTLEEFRGKISKEIPSPATPPEAVKENLEHAVASSLEALRGHSEALLQKYRQELENALDEYRAKSAREVRYQLDQVAATFREESTRESRHQEERIEELHRRIESYTQEGLAAFKREILASKLQSNRRRIVFLLGAWVIGLVALMTFAYNSTRRVMRLRTDPPAEFIAIGPDIRPSQRDAEEKLARSYWDCAVQQIQQGYKFGMTLPPDPPAEFKPPGRDGMDVALKPSQKAARVRYWQRLRTSWEKTETWEETYIWDSTWIGDSLKPLGEKLRVMLGQ